MKELPALGSIMILHTRRIGLIGKVGPIYWTRNVDTPKGASHPAFLQTRQIHMARKSAVGESIGEVGRVDAVLKFGPDQDGKIIMTI